MASAGSWTLEIVSREGGEGGVRQFNFTSAEFGFIMKQSLEFAGADKIDWKSTLLVENCGVGEAIETATSHIKMEPAAGGGSVLKVDSIYKLLQGVEVKDEIAKPAKAKEFKLKRD